MNKIFFFVLVSWLSATAFSAEKSIYDLSAKTIFGEKFSLNKYKGNVVLIVNIASRCGYTPQLESLQQLYEKHRDKKFVIIGVPSNEFGGQSPESNKEMASFCKLNYGVNFPLLSKAQVTGKNKHPLFKHLIDNEKNKKEISWNFEKFLIGKDGRLIKRFKSGDSPLGDKIGSAIRRAFSKYN